MRLRRYAARANLLVAAVLMLAMWVLIVWVASRPALKTLIDLTPQQVNSVDPATEELLKELRDRKVEIEFHLFFPRVQGQPQDETQYQEMAIIDRLRNLTKLLLDRYQWLGGELVKIWVHDLVGNLAATREAAQAFAYTGPDDAVVVSVRQPGRERRFRKLSWMEIATIERPETRAAAGSVPRVGVPVLKGYHGEQDISSAIKSLLVQGTPVAYFLNSYSRIDFTNAAIGDAYGSFVASLGKLGFETRVLELDAARGRVIPADASLVIVLEPRYEFSDSDATVLYEYVKRGGRLFLNYTWTTLPDRNPTGGKLGELLGFELGTARVHHLIPDAGRAGGKGLDGNEAVAKLQLVVNDKHPVTRRLPSRPYEVGDARPLRARSAPPGITYTELLSTGPAAWLAAPGPDGRPDLRSPGPRLLGTVDVGAAIEVTAAAAAPAVGSSPAEPRNGQVVIVSGYFANNVGLPHFGDLAFNICNWMAERNVMMNIQSGGYTARQMQLVPPQVERVRWLLVYGVPLAFLVGGFVVFYLRRRI